VFGTSGIRGIYGNGIDEALARKISVVFTEGKLVVGRDIRESGPSLLEAITQGALQVGAHVIDCGILPTPTLALATKKHGCRGIMITASHNPPEYNGLKLIEDGKEIDKTMETEVVRRYGGPMPQKQEGGGVFSDGEILCDHKELITELVDSQAINKKKPKVIVDCNGAAYAITPRLLSDLGCRVVSVNSSRHCFNRPSEPRVESLGYLPGLICASGADFAIAHDGDGDRCMVFDERGEMLPLDVQLAMMIEHELEGSKNKKVISTVESSLTIREVVERGGGSLEITRVGSTSVGDALEAKKAHFGGEPAGEYIYREGVHVPDAILAAAKFAEIFSRKGAFSRLKTRYPQNFIAREKFPAKDKHATMERIKGSIRVEGRTREDDGIRVDEDDGWFLIRASGTEPIVRLTMEYKTKEGLQDRKRMLESIIRRHLG
jgi:phosphoglucosamine mutase